MCRDVKTSSPQNQARAKSYSRIPQFNTESIKISGWGVLCIILSKCVVISVESSKLGLAMANSNLFYLCGVLFSEAGVVKTITIFRLTYGYITTYRNLIWEACNLLLFAITKPPINTIFFTAELCYSQCCAMPIHLQLSTITDKKPSLILTNFINSTLILLL